MNYICHRRLKLINSIFTYSFQTTPTILDPSPVSSMARGIIRPTISSSSMARGMNRPVQGVRVIPEKNDRINRTGPREFRNKTVLRNSSPGNSQQPPRTRIFTADRKKLFRSNSSVELNNRKPSKLNPVSGFSEKNLSDARRTIESQMRNNLLSQGNPFKQSEASGPAETSSETTDPTSHKASVLQSTRETVPASTC